MVQNSCGLPFPHWFNQSSKWTLALLAAVAVGTSGCRFGNNMPSPEKNGTPISQITPDSTIASTTAVPKDSKPIKLVYFPPAANSAAKPEVKPKPLPASQISPFGTAKLPIPRGHLEDLESRLAERENWEPSKQKTAVQRAKERAKAAIVEEQRKQKLAEDLARGRLKATQAKQEDMSQEISASAVMPGSVVQEAAKKEPAKSETAKAVSKIKDEPKAEPKPESKPQPVQEIAKAVANPAVEPAREILQGDIAQPKLNPAPEVKSEPAVEIQAEVTPPKVVPEMKSPLDHLLGKLGNSKQALIYQGIIALALLALLLITVWYRLEREHIKGGNKK